MLPLILRERVSVYTCSKSSEPLSEIVVNAHTEAACTFIIARVNVPPQWPR